MSIDEIIEPVDEALETIDEIIEPVVDETLDDAKEMKKKKPFKVYNTKEELKGYESQLKSKLEAEFLKSLGLGKDERDKLDLIKKTYEDTLGNEERLTKDITMLKDDILDLQNKLQEKEYVILAISKMSNVELSEVDKLVKMAKGLKDDTNTIDDTLTSVLEMIKVNKPTKKPISSEPLNNPPDLVEKNINPFKTETFDMTKQGELFRQDPIKARRLAKEAGKPIVY